MRKQIGLLLAGAAFLPFAAQAQSEDARTDGSSDIVVTAQRYEQRLMDVPLSVSAVTSKDIAQRSVTSLQDMQYTVPGLSSFRYGPGATEYIQLRGMANSVGAPTVGFYLDEMPVTAGAQGSNLDVRLLDIERVEVLRGPQATLYGENSMGGTIRYITAAPKFDRYEGAFEGEAGKANDGGWGYRANGMINMPLVDDMIALRLVAGYEKQPGWIDNRALGVRDANDADVYTVRAKLGVKLGERGKISVLAQHQESDQDFMNLGIGGVSNVAVPLYNRDNYEIYQGTFDYELDGVNLTATAGYLDRRTRVQADLTSYFLPALEAPPPFGAGLPPGFITQITAPGSNRFKSFSAELRLASAGTGPLRWSLGGYLRNTRSILGSTAETTPGTLPFVVYEAHSTDRSNSFALYGEVSYHFSETLSLLGGLRYYRDRRNQQSTSIGFGVPSANGGKATFDTINPRLNLRYTPSRNSTYYVNVAKGFRSGGFNTASVPGQPLTYEPDSVWSYEVGTKQQLFDRKLSFDIAAYYNDWKGVQSSFVPLGTAFLITSNNGAVRGFGVDASLTLRPVRGLTLSGSFGWNNLENKVATADKLPGDPPDFAASESWSASADYRTDLTDAVIGFITADYQHVGKASASFRTIGQIYRFQPRDMVNARMGVEIDAFEISVFARNLFDTRTPLTPAPFGTLPEETALQPRTIGVNVKAKF